MVNRDTEQPTPHFDDRPVVLCFSGLDPCGGAGIQADIESINASGCHTASIVTCITAQNTQTVHSWQPVSAEMLSQQARLIFADFNVSAIKIGMIGTLQTLDVIEQCLLDHPSLPVVLDPVLQSGAGQSLAQQQLYQHLVERLIPKITLLTPNTLELAALELRAGRPPTDDIESAVFWLLRLGCTSVCATGGHLETAQIRNRLWQANQLVYDRLWPRIAGEFHGTGCTFAAAAASFLAQGMPLIQAVAQADELTWQAVAQAVTYGRGQAIPNRAFSLHQSTRRPFAKKHVEHSQHLGSRDA